MGCITLLLETDAEAHEAAKACPSIVAGAAASDGAAEMQRYALVASVSTGGAPLLGRLTARQEAAGGGLLRWQRFFQTEGSALQLDVDMRSAALVAPAVEPAEAASPSVSQAPGMPEGSPLQVCAVPPASDGNSTVPEAPAAAPAAEVPASVVALDRSVPEFLQRSTHLVCPVPAVARASGDRPGAAAAATAPPRLWTTLRQMLRSLGRSEAAVLGISSACAVEFVLLAVVLLRRQQRQRRPAAATSSSVAATPPQPTAPHHRAAGALAGTPRSLSKVLRDACCSPMVPTALLAALRNPSLAWGGERLAAIPEGQEEDSAAAAPIGWTR